MEGVKELDYCCLDLLTEGFLLDRFFFVCKTSLNFCDELQLIFTHVKLSRFCITVFLPAKYVNSTLGACHEEMPGVISTKSKLPNDGSLSAYALATEDVALMIVLDPRDDLAFHHWCQGLDRRGWVPYLDPSTPYLHV